MAQVRWSEVALNDLAEIQRAIAQDSPTAATVMVRRLRSDALRLERFPLSGRSVPEVDNPCLREVIVRPYRLISSVDADGLRVEIVTIIHGRRQLPTLNVDR